MCTSLCLDYSYYPFTINPLMRSPKFCCNKRSQHVTLKNVCSFLPILKSLKYEIWIIFSTVTENNSVSIIKKKKSFSYVIAAGLSPYPGSGLLYFTLHTALVGQQVASYKLCIMERESLGAPWEENPSCYLPPFPLILQTAAACDPFKPPLADFREERACAARRVRTVQPPPHASRESCTCRPSVPAACAHSHRPAPGPRGNW